MNRNKLVTLKISKNIKCTDLKLDSRIILEDEIEANILNGFIFIKFEHKIKHL